MADAAPPAEIGYAAALAELESILAEIEDDAVDVDVLAARVRRAAWWPGRAMASTVSARGPNERGGSCGQLN